MLAVFKAGGGVPAGRPGPARPERVGLLLADARPTLVARRPPDCAATPAWTACALARPATGRPTGPAALRAGQHRLRHLHLRLHRQAQGRRGRAPRPGRTCCCSHRAGFAAEPAADRCGSALTAVVLLRHLPGRPAAAGRRPRAAPGRRGRPGWTRPPSSTTSPSTASTSSTSPRPTCASCCPPGCSTDPRHRPAVLMLGGEALGRRRSGGELAAAPDIDRVQLLRPHRVHGRRAVLPDRRGRPARWSGRPLRNTRAYVLDAALQPVPPGVAGELYLAGAQVGPRLPGPPGPDRRAVRGRPVRTAGSRMYRTGDLVRWTRRRHAGVPRPRRRPGQDPRLPHRAGRGRGRAARRCPASPRPRSSRTGRRRPPAAGRLRRAARTTDAARHRRPARRAAADAARLHGARPRSSPLDALPLDHQRQARPPRAARARRVADRRTEPRRAAHRDEQMLAGIWAEVLGVRRGRRRGTTSSSSAATRS